MAARRSPHGAMRRPEALTRAITERRANSCAPEMSVIQWSEVSPQRSVRLPRVSLHARYARTRGTRWPGCDHRYSSRSDYNLPTLVSRGGMRGVNEEMTARGSPTLAATLALLGVRNNRTGFFFFGRFLGTLADTFFRCRPCAASGRPFSSFYLCSSRLPQTPLPCRALAALHQAWGLHQPARRWYSMAALSTPLILSPTRAFEQLIIAPCRTLCADIPSLTPYSRVHSSASAPVSDMMIYDVETGLVNRTTGFLGAISEHSMAGAQDSSGTPTFVVASGANGCALRKCLW